MGCEVSTLNEWTSVNQSITMGWMDDIRLTTIEGAKCATLRGRAAPPRRPPPPRRNNALKVAPISDTRSY